jgi:hypothetical protein
VLDTVLFWSETPVVGGSHWGHTVAILRWQRPCKLFFSFLSQESYRVLNSSTQCIQPWCLIIWPKEVAEFSALLSIRDFPSLNFGPETEYPDMFLWFSLVFSEKWGSNWRQGEWELPDNGSHHLIMNIDAFKVFWKVLPSVSPRYSLLCHRKATFNLRKSFSRHRCIFCVPVIKAKLYCGTVSIFNVVVLNYFLVIIIIPPI